MDRTTEAVWGKRDEQREAELRAEIAKLEEQRALLADELLRRVGPTDVEMQDAAIAIEEGRRDWSDADWAMNDALELADTVLQLREFEKEDAELGEV